MPPALLQMRNSKSIYVAFFIQYIYGCVPTPAFVPPGEFLVSPKSQNAEGVAWEMQEGSMGAACSLPWGKEGTGGGLLRVEVSFSGCSMLLLAAPHYILGLGKEGKASLKNGIIE